MAHYQLGLVGAGVGAGVRVVVELSALSHQGGARRGAGTFALPWSRKDSRPLIVAHCHSH